MPRPASRVTVLALALAATTALHTVTIPANPAWARSPGSPTTERLVGTWSASSDRLTAPISGQTVRMVVRTSIGGAGVRIRLSNVFGSRPITFRSVHVGIQAYGAEIVAGTNQPVTFGGRTQVTIPAGQAAWSDPAPLTAPANSDLAVSLYVPMDVREITGHERAFATTHLSRLGDYSASETADGFVFTSTQWYFLDRIAVSAPANARSVVAFGDSLTDGAGQLVDTNRRWTDYLYRRLPASAKRRWGVLNAGIAGNRILRPNVGPSGLSRFRRDVLAQPGVRTVIIYAGINDISRGNYTSAKPLIEAYQKLVKQAHARKVRVLGATLTPFYGFGTWTPEREEIRQRVNRWIRSSRLFDGVVDFDRAVRDPLAPEQLAAAYDSGDHLHMSDAGRATLAQTVDLRSL